jgi:hypothetical protein
MHGAREILALAGPAIHLEQQLDAIEAAVPTAPGLAADLARTLVETVCKTILVDRGQECDGLGYKDLLQRTYAAIQLVPRVEFKAQNATAALQQLALNLDAAILGISLLRQAGGVASHGKDAYVVPIEAVQGEFAARAADALAVFLYKTHRGSSGITVRRTREFEQNAELNDWIDGSNAPAVIFELEFRPSEVLYHVDREAYLDALATFSGLVLDSEESA